MELITLYGGAEDGTIIKLSDSTIDFINVMGQKYVRSDKKDSAKTIFRLLK